MFSQTIIQNNPMSALAVNVMLTYVLTACSPAKQEDIALEVNNKPVKESTQLSSEAAKNGGVHEVRAANDTDNSAHVNIDGNINANTRANKIDKTVFPKKPIFGKKVIKLNAEKFEYLGGPIKKGTPLYNLTMASTGIVKGSFVAVTKADKPLNTLPIALKEQQKIAKSTYRIVPVKGDNLELIYRLLLANSNLKQVELEIDYSNLTKAETF